jgi:hypothetical protein
MRSPTCLLESRVYSSKKLRSTVQKDFCNTIGTLLPRAKPSGCPQTGESGLCIVIATRGEGERIAALDAEIDALQRQTLALGGGPSTDVPPCFYLG